MRVRVLTAFRDKHGRDVNAGRVLDVPDAEAHELRHFVEPYDPPPPPPEDPEPHRDTPMLVVATRAYVRHEHDRAEWTFPEGSLFILPLTEARAAEKAKWVRRITATELRQLVGWPTKEEQ